MRDLVTSRIGALPTATGGLTRIAYAHAREAGVELEPLLRKVGLTDRQIEDRGIRLSVHQQITFLDLAASALHDDLLGFHLAQLPDIRALGMLYYVAASSETLGDALQRAARYSSITNEALSLKYNGGQDVRIVFNYVGVARHLDRHQIEFCVTALVRLCRHLTGMRLVPSQVSLIHRRANGRPELAAYFGRNIEFAATADEVVFAAAAKHMKVATADPYLNELLVRNCEEALSRRSTSRGTFRSTVENTIIPLLPHGKARAGEIARALGLSQRTFARRLSLEGLTFSAVLDALRADLAVQYLKDEGLTVSRIAWLLGYQEISAFTHAFRRWTGKTPREARAQQEVRADGGGG